MVVNAKSKVDIINKHKHPKEITEGRRKTVKYFYLCNKNDELKIISEHLYNYKSGKFYIVENVKNNEKFMIDENDIEIEETFEFE